jgi:protein-tyrosine phosphatase
MIDLHCHLLPGLDDGSKNMDESIRLARIAIDNGITHAVMTPHITPGRYDNSLATITPVYKEFVKALEQHNLPLQIGMAAEVRLDPLIIEMVESGSLPCLGEHEGCQVLLLEFPYDNIPPGSMDMVQWLIKRRIKPLIAHPERNRAVIRNIDVLEPFIKSGCLLQITACSLTGVFGRHSEKSVLQLLQRGWVSIMSTDAHNLQTRPPELEAGRCMLAKIVGEAESWQMVKERPMQIAHKQFAQMP